MILFIAKIENKLQKILPFIFAFSFFTFEISGQSLIPSYKVETFNKKFLFVMLNDFDYQNNKSNLKQFPKSGMYLNNDPKTLLWSIDWKGFIWLPEDGIHVVKIEESDYEGITFCKNGIPIKTYKVNNLIDFPWILPEKNSNQVVWQKKIGTDQRENQLVLWLGGKDPSILETGVIFNEENHTMLLKTTEGSSYLFDYQTGNIITAYRPLRILLIIAFFIFIILYLVYCIYRINNFDLQKLKIKKILYYNLICSMLFLFFEIIINDFFQKTPEPSTFLGALWKLTFLLPILALKSLFGYKIQYNFLHWMLANLIFWFLIFLIFNIINQLIILLIYKINKFFYRKTLCKNANLH